MPFLAGKKHHNYKHGLSNSSVYNMWCRMKRRCYDTHRAGYKDYGGRGIMICDEWLRDPKAFYDWAMANGFEEKLTLERIDVNGDYCPENCTFIPMGKQQRNRRKSIRVQYDGKIVSARDVEDALGMTPKTIQDRIRRGWTEDRLLLPQQKKKAVWQKTKEGIIIAWHDSAATAANVVNGKPTGINRCLAGTYHRHTHRGFVWEYACEKRTT